MVFTKLNEGVPKRNLKLDERTKNALAHKMIII